MSTSVFQQIARRVGVSPRTVQRTLLGQLRDTRPTYVKRAKMIRQLAKELDYRPNAAARATATGRFGVVSLLLSTDTEHSYLPTEMLAGIEDELIVAGEQLHVARLTDAALTDERFIPRALREWSSDGLLVNYQYAIPAKLVELINHHRLPSIWMNACLDADCIYPDEFDAGVQATQWLLSQGRRRITYVDFSHGLLELPRKHFSARDRLAGYEHAMHQAGLTPQRIGGYEDHVRNRERMAAAMALIDSPDRPQAVLTYGNIHALPVIVAAKMRQVSIGSDLTVMTFSERPLEILDEFVPSVCINTSDLGRRSVRLLQQKIKSPDEPLPPVRLKYVLSLSPAR